MLPGCSAAWIRAIVPVAVTSIFVFSARLPMHMPGINCKHMSPRFAVLLHPQPAHARSFAGFDWVQLQGLVEYLGFDLAHCFDCTHSLDWVQLHGLVEYLGFDLAHCFDRAH
jgi:hypothetical protein